MLVIMMMMMITIPTVPEHEPGNRRRPWLSRDGHRHGLRQGGKLRSRPPNLNGKGRYAVRDK